MVGDDAQAIYSFRAAAVENILGFPDRFTPRAEVVTLAQNYRSTPAGARRRQRADGRGAAPAPQAPAVDARPGRAPAATSRVDELQTQAEYVCAEVLKRREAGVPLRAPGGAVPQRQRTATCSKSSSRKRKIPFVKYGGLKFLEAAHVKDLLAVLRWADNPRNALAAFRVLQLLPGMGPANAQRNVDRACQQAGGFARRCSRTFKPPQPARASTWASSPS